MDEQAPTPIDDQAVIKILITVAVTFAYYIGHEYVMDMYVYSDEEYRDNIKAIYTLNEKARKVKDQIAFGT